MIIYILKYTDFFSYKQSQLETHKFFISDHQSKLFLSQKP